MCDVAFIGWTDHGRSQGIAASLKAENWVIEHPGRPKLLEYILNLRSTWRRLRSKRPRIIIFMQPPMPLLVLLWIYQLSHREVKIVADLHSGFFNDRKWRWFATTGLTLLRRHAVIVTNEYLAAIARRKVRRVVILHDILSKVAAPDRHSSDSAHVLFPLSYAADEPVQAIVDAARLLHRDKVDIEFRLTGAAPQHLRDSAPPSVRFLGWLDDDQFIAEMGSAKAVGALTLRDHTMQRAGYEALQLGTPVITSPWPVLMQYFGGSAKYAEPTADSIAESVRSMLQEWEQYRATTLALRQQRLSEQAAALNELRSICCQ